MEEIIPVLSLSYIHPPHKISINELSMEGPASIHLISSPTGIRS